MKERFWDKVIKSEQCWVWNGSKSFYVGVSAEGKKISMSPRRFLYDCVEKELDSSEKLFSKCGNVACVRPAHQSVVSTFSRSTECFTCGKNIRIARHRMDRSISGNFYCSRSCATVENNRLKIKSWSTLKNRASVRDKYLREVGNLICAHCFFDGTHKPWCIQIDHKQRVFDGGTNKLQNLQPLCLNCHADKCVTEMRK